MLSWCSDSLRPDGLGLERLWGESFSFLFTCPDRSWGTPSPLFNRCWNFFLWVKRPRLGIPTPSRVEVKHGQSYTAISAPRLHLHQGAQVFQKRGRYLKIPGARYVSWSKVHTEDPQTLKANVKISPPLRPETRVLYIPAFH